jgi:hypothetical protein
MLMQKEMLMKKSVLLCCLAAIAMLAVPGCLPGSTGGADPQGGSGGATGGSAGGASSGGNSNTAKGGSGGTTTSTGGVTGSGGSSATSSGGTTSGGGSQTGGTTASGGSNGSGGGRTGGTTASGGTTSNGGTTASGGTTGTGGMTVKGGTTGSGGSASAGGTTAKGGTAGSGGVTGTGGTAARGGTTGSGGTTSTSTAAKFSFFVVSYAAIQKIAGSTKGLGGDLRHGETGNGAGLRGADKICSEVAEGSMAGAGAKTWRAFLSATADENGKQVNAIERIGSGPWYDRLGRLFANNLSELTSGDRPQNADAAIKSDFPNENGVLNQNPDKTGNVDNHDMLTGTNNTGKLYGTTATCSDWTSTATSGSKPRVGHSWCTSMGGGGGSMGGGMGGMCNWMSALDESGCAPGVNLIQNGGPGNDGTVGSGGGYGGWYCFALTP